MAVLKQRKIDGEHHVFQDKGQINISSLHRKGIPVFRLFRNNIEYSFRCEGHEVLS